MAGTQFYYGLRRVELILLFYASAMITMLLFPFYWGQTSWVAAGVGFTVFVLGHMCILASRCVILPELITFVACLSWVIAPWLSYKYPPSFSLYAMYVSPDMYFSYTVPVVVALWIGIHIPLKFNPTHEHTSRWITIPLSNRDRFFMDGLVFVGFFSGIVSRYLPSSLAFFFYILAQLRFVGAFSLMFTRAKGWPIRVTIVFISLIVQTASVGLFYELVLWMGYLLIAFAYVYRWRMKLIVFLALGLAFIVPLNSIKAEYRMTLGFRDTTTYEKVKILLRLVVREIEGKKNVDGYYSNYNSQPGDHLVRWNQGWIVSKIMDTVPDKQPYANGETILTSLFASLVPRVWLPGKLGATSREVFTRFTGLMLPETTTMALGISGEMYANFGLYGGVLAVLLYSIFIGFIFSKFAQAARKNLLWWAWAPFVLLPAVEAEWNLVDILNHITKSLIVMVFLIYWIPPFKRILWKKGITHAELEPQPTFSKRPR